MQNGNVSLSDDFTVTVNPTREIDVLGNAVKYYRWRYLPCT
jgi:hypothetical protein